jgi:hypothetical protein
VKKLSPNMILIRKKYDSHDYFSQGGAISNMASIVRRIEELKRRNYDDLESKEYFCQIAALCVRAMNAIDSVIDIKESNASIELVQNNSQK